LKEWWADLSLVKSRAAQLRGSLTRLQNAFLLSNRSAENIILLAMALNQDFKEFFELLNKHKVKYLVVGGYSVAIHGHPRYTKDIDVWILTNKENAKAILRALTDFGFGPLDLTVADFESPGQVVQLGNAPARIDILTSLTGVEFESCWGKRLLVEDGDLSYPVISLEDLKQNKRALGRHQDLADLEELGD